MIESVHSPARLLVIGWGNPSRSDDGAAYAAVAHLCERLGSERPALDVPLLAWSTAPQPAGITPTGVRVDYLLLHQLAPELAAHLVPYAAAVFVDAGLAEGRSGLDLHPLPSAQLTLPVSHSVSPAVVLTLARAMHGRAPEAHLLTLAGRNFNFGTTLSPDTAAAARQAADWILELAETLPSPCTIPVNPSPGLRTARTR